MQAEAKSRDPWSHCETLQVSTEDHSFPGSVSECQEATKALLIPVQDEDEELRSCRATLKVSLKDQDHAANEENLHIVQELEEELSVELDIDHRVYEDEELSNSSGSWNEENL